MTVVDAESRFHVLAVDESVIDRKLIKMLLKTSSYQVTTVDFGSKALEVLGLRDEDDDSASPSSSSSPDRQDVGVNLIITDYCMPGMTGYDLLRRVKRQTFTRRTSRTRSSSTSTCPTLLATQVTIKSLGAHAGLVLNPLPHFVRYNMFLNELLICLNICAAYVQLEQLGNFQLRIHDQMITLEAAKATRSC